MNHLHLSTASTISDSRVFSIGNNEVIAFTETRVISLKSRTRQKRADGTETQFKVEDNTFISNLKKK